MQCQILLVIHKWIQGNLERESGNLSEVTYSKAFLQASLQLDLMDNKDIAERILCDETGNVTVRKSTKTSLKPKIYNKKVLT